MLALTREMIVVFINKITTEFMNNSIRSKEILQIQDHYVSDVVNKNYYTERENQKVIKSANENIKRTLETFFGKDFEYSTKKKNFGIINASKYDDLLQEHPLKNYGDRLIQTIFPENNTLLRAYATGYNWIENMYQNINIRNLGYYSQKQTDIMVYLKSLIIDWMLDQQNKKEIDDMLSKYNIGDNVYTYITKLASNALSSASCDIEIIILNKIQKIPIVIYDDNEIVKVFDEQILSSKLEKYEKRTDTINLRFNYIQLEMGGKYSKIPSTIDAVYFIKK
jgi:hypothetical protein